MIASTPAPSSNMPTDPNAGRGGYQQTAQPSNWQADLMDQLDKAVRNGRISQTQADQIFRNCTRQHDQQ